MSKRTDTDQQPDISAAPPPAPNPAKPKPAPAEAQPSSGGSYVRNGDGSLTLAEAPAEHLDPDADRAAIAQRQQQEG